MIWMVLFWAAVGIAIGSIITVLMLLIVDLITDWWNEIDIYGRTYTPPNKSASSGRADTRRDNSSVAGGVTEERRGWRR